MSQQFLDRAQVGAVRQQMRGVGVTETVRVHRRIARQVRCVELHDAADASRGQPPAAMVEEHRRFVALHLALAQVSLQRARRLPWKRHLTLLASLSAHPQPAFRAVHVLEVQPCQLAHPDAASIEHFENGAIARRERTFQLVCCNPVDQRVRLLGGHHFRQLFRRLRRAHQPRNVDVNHALAQQKTEQAAHRRQLPPDGDRAQIVAVQRRQPLTQHQQVDRPRLRRLKIRRRKVFQELCQVRFVCPNRVL